MQNIQVLMDEIEIGETYQISGDDYTLIIKPINAIFIDNSTHVNFSECEDILRSELNISNLRILTFFQMEIQSSDEKFLTNKLEYQVYDDNKKSLDLSLCSNANINIFYAVKDKLLNISSISSFKDSGIDILNINDSFFNDICKSYSNSNNDIILSDRIKDIYQNYSLCNDGCEYNGFDIENKTISCLCKVKSNMSINDTYLNIKKFDEINIDSNYGIIKCYNLVFSFNNKLKNIGFWIFLVLLFLHISMITKYFYNGMETIKEYILKEMVTNGYLKKQDINDNLNKKQKKNLRKKSFIVSPPLKKNINNNHNKINKIKKKKKIKINETFLNSKIKLLNNNLINEIINKNLTNIENMNFDNNKIIINQLNIDDHLNNKSCNIHKNNNRNNKNKRIYKGKKEIKNKKLIKKISSRKKKN